MSARDADKAKVYEAESDLRLTIDRGVPVTLFGTTVACPEERKFGRVEDVQRFVDCVLAHEPVQALSSRAGRPIKVRQRQGIMAAHYEPWGHVIAVPDTRFGLREVTVLHEMAHALDESHSEPDHGPRFRTLLCGLLEAVLSPEARFLLQVGYGERGLSA